MEERSGAKGGQRVEWKERVTKGGCVEDRRKRGWRNGVMEEQEVEKWKEELDGKGTKGGTVKERTNKKVEEWRYGGRGCKSGGIE